MGDWALVGLVGETGGDRNGGNPCVYVTLVTVWLRGRL